MLKTLLAKEYKIKLFKPKKQKNYRIKFWGAATIAFPLEYAATELYVSDRDYKKALLLHLKEMEDIYNRLSERFAKEGKTLERDYFNLLSSYYYNAAHKIIGDIDYEI